MGTERQRFDGLSHEVVKIELDLLQLQFPRLDLGKIQNVIDYIQKRLAGGFDHEQVLTLFLSQCGIQGKFGHTHDSIDESADLMAHIGEELTFCLAGCFRNFPGIFQLNICRQ